MTMSRQIVYSALRTSDGVTLVSRHRHDYVEHTSPDGKYYMLDGGLDYVRCTPGDGELITVYDDEPFEKVRKYFHWGVNYDKNMNRLPETKWTPLAALKTDHIETILDGGYAKSKWVRTLMENELQYRLKMTI